jgi:ribosomal protein S18 acetylase RimI-like enzyme
MTQEHMSDEETVERYSRALNTRLEHGQQESDAPDAALTEIGREAVDPALAERLVANARQAIHPCEFFDARALTPDLIFDQCDALLRRSFDPAELEPKARFAAMIERLRDPSHTWPLLMMGRFWRVSGPQRYDATGRLVCFGFDPLSVTESIAAAVVGHYMSLRPIGRSGESIGALGNIVTREHFRGGQGHGSALAEAFEREMVRVAQARGETLRLYILESQGDSQAFWYKLGYRWPQNTRYAQPPLEFDPVTGERVHDEVPETLMVKLVGQPDATTVDAELLLAAVRIMYINWCLAETKKFPPAAARRAEEYVLGKVLGEFRASLPPDGQPVALVKPPRVH